MSLQTLVVLAEPGSKVVVSEHEVKCKADAEGITYVYQTGVFDYKKDNTVASKFIN